MKALVDDNLVLGAVIALFVCAVYLGFFNWPFSSSPPVKPGSASTAQNQKESEPAPEKPVNPVAAYLAEAKKSHDSWAGFYGCAPVAEDLDAVMKKLAALEDAAKEAKKKQVADRWNRVRSVILRYRAGRGAADERRTAAFALTQAVLPGAGDPDGVINWKSPKDITGKAATTLSEYVNRTFLPHHGVTGNGTYDPIDRVAAESQMDFSQLLELIAEDALVRREKYRTCGSSH